MTVRIVLFRIIVICLEEGMQNVLDCVVLT